MTKDQVFKGGHYIAKVSNKITVVRVDDITKQPKYNPRTRLYTGKSTRYACTNMVTGREIGIKSAAKMRRFVPQGVVHEMVDIYR